MQIRYERCRRSGTPDTLSRFFVQFLLCTPAYTLSITAKHSKERAYGLNDGPECVVSDPSHRLSCRSEVALELLLWYYLWNRLVPDPGL
jgi:hypothetical protein